MRRDSFQDGCEGATRAFRGQSIGFFVRWLERQGRDEEVMAGGWFHIAVGTVGVCDSWRAI